MHQPRVMRSYSEAGLQSFASALEHPDWRTLFSVFLVKFCCSCLPGLPLPYRPLHFAFPAQPLISASRRNYFGKNAEFGSCMPLPLT